MLARPNIVPVFALGLAGFALAAMAGTRPLLTLAGIGLLGFAVLAFAAPVVHLTLFVGMTVIVPYSVLNAGGFLEGLTGALDPTITDVLLLTGLGRAAMALSITRLDRTRALALALTLAFLGAATVQLLHGLREGAGLSGAGFEYRALLGYAAIVIALPMLADERQRSGLALGMLAVGLALGAWGMIQLLTGITLSESQDFGLRTGSDIAVEGKLQLQGGLYGFPVAVVIAYAVLISGRASGLRLPLLAVLVLNGVSLLLTYERTLWLAALIGCAFVTLRLGRVQRARAVLAAPLVLAVVLIPLAAVSPDTLTTARERLLSLGQYGSDKAVSFRFQEGEAVVAAIAERPLVGSGMGAEISFARPDVGVFERATFFTHNGYLWLGWKLGLAALALFLAGLALAITRRGIVTGSPAVAATALGCQGALLALAAVNVTFPAFTQFSATAMVGLLLAFCATPRRQAREGAQPAAA